MDKMTVSTQRHFDTPRKKVWEILTNGKYTKQYMFGCEPQTNWEKGSELLWKDPNGKVLVKGKIVEVEKGSKLHYTTFDPNAGIEDTAENYMLVTCDLIGQGNICLLKVTQGDFSGAEDAQKRYKECKQGWQYVFDGMRKLLTDQS